MKRVVAALILKDGKILICQRTKEQSMALRWEFPGGKVEEGESDPQALQRELNEELGIDATIGRHVLQVVHTYKNGGAVEIQFFLVEDFSGELQNVIFEDIRWVRREELTGFAFLEADLDLVKGLAAGKFI